MTYKYISTAQNFFDSWRIWFYVFVLLLLLSIFGGMEWPLNLFLFPILVALGLVLFIMLLRISVVTRNAQKLHCKSIVKEKALNNITGIETWWSYDFSPADPVYAANGATGKSQQLINYIYVYARVFGKNDSIVLFELIQLSSKFPASHPYRPEALSDEDFTFKVYDVDKCLQKLKLDHLLNLDPQLK